MVASPAIRLSSTAKDHATRENQALEVAPRRGHASHHHWHPLFHRSGLAAYTFGLAEPPNRLRDALHHRAAKRVAGAARHCLCVVPPMVRPGPLVRIGRLRLLCLKWARLEGADLSADMRNQSMGLMRGILRSAKLDGANFTNANLSRAVLEFASLRDAIFKGARLDGSELAGADLQGADITDANFDNADVTSTRLVGLRGRDKALNLDRAKNLERAFLD